MPAMKRSVFCHISAAFPTHIFSIERLRGQDMLHKGLLSCADGEVMCQRCHCFHRWRAIIQRQRSCISIPTTKRHLARQLLPRMAALKKQDRHRCTSFHRPRGLPENRSPRPAIGHLLVLATLMGIFSGKTNAGGTCWRSSKVGQGSGSPKNRVQVTQKDVEAVSHIQAHL